MDNPRNHALVHQYFSVILLNPFCWSFKALQGTFRFLGCPPLSARFCCSGNQQSQFTHCALHASLYRLSVKGLDQIIWQLQRVCVKGSRNSQSSLIGPNVITVSLKLSQCFNGNARLPERCSKDCFVCLQNLRYKQIW